MANNYTLWIVSPPGLIWSHVFDEVALGLQSAFRQLGYEVSIVTDPQGIEGVPIVLGANLCPMYHISLPENAIIYNLEQVHPDSRWFQPGYGYIDLLKQHSVWDFSKKNIKGLKTFGVENVIHCVIGYAPELTRIRREKEDVDVVFVGGNHPRRKQVMDRIAAGGARLHQVYKVFGKQRDDWIARGKIHLNIHKEPARLFEMVRVSYLLANRCFVVSETPDDQEMIERFKDGLAFCPYDELVERCLYYLVHPKKRKAIAEAGFELFRTMPQAEYLATALEEQQRLPSPSPLVGEGGERGNSQQTLQSPILQHLLQHPPLPNPPPQGGRGIEKIFVAIASYRDPEIQPTLQALFAKATHPGRIHAGVCLQVDPETDKECMIDFGGKPGRITVRQYHYRESKGANWARNQALQMIENESYVLLIDSHMRFTQGWDEAMLAMLAACPSEKPVLSGYSPDYRPPDRLIHHHGYLLRTRLRPLGNPNDPRLVHVSGALVELADERTKMLYPTPFCVANFIFTHAATFKEVPIDPYIYFWGDEINFAARLWTHGYDIFQPDRIVLYHYWVRQELFHLHEYREYFTAENTRSIERIRHLLGFQPAKDPLALVDIERYGLGNQRELGDLWRFAGIDWNTRKITVGAEKGIWNMAARDKGIKTNASSSDEMEKTGLPRIFVQIASYRDPDCQWTVKDLFEKAAHSERIFVGICWQFVREEDGICFQVPYPYPDQVRVHEVDARQGRGVCWARGLVQKLWQGEEFTLQIDSHMRFEPGWDEMLLAMWKECGNEKAVLTCYPPGFTPPDQFERKFIFGMSAKEFDKEGIFLMIGKPAYEVGRNEPAKPMQGAFASANCIFGPSSIITDVPYDPHLYFFGEEITLAVRLWSSGYDLFHPNRLVIFHDWNRGKRPTHFSDCRDWVQLNKRSFARVRHLLNTEISTDPEIIAEIEKYGLGKVRTLDEYQAFSGVDFATKTISMGAYKGQFGLTPSPAQRGRVGEGAFGRIPPSPTLPLSGRGNALPRIFVNIASYRDPECQWTVKDLFEKAAHPDRINVGICWQFDPVEDRHCFEVTTRPLQVRMMPVNWREAEGVCWARHQAQQLWEGEEYTLMIDSHMRFVPGWDELMLQELAACESNKPVLSCSPPRYTPPNNLTPDMNPAIRRAKPFMPDGNIRCQGEMLDRSPPKPLKGAFLVANFVFSRSEIISEVPYDPFLYFDQEEITYAARLYTHGWDIFSSRQQFLYHFYNDHKAPGGTVRALHWRDLHKENEPRIRFLRDRGLKRFNHLTGYAFSNDPNVVQQLDSYGFGRERTLAQFEEFSGVDFKNKIATEKALRCGFIENLHLYRDRPIHVPELDDNKGSAGIYPLPAPLQPKNVSADVQSMIKMLEPGDFFPLLEIDDTNKKVRAIEVFAGKFSIAGYLPANHPEFLALFFRQMSLRLVATKLQEIWQIFILDETPDKLEELRQRLQISPVLYADPNRAIARSFGIARAAEPIVPVGFVLDPNFKIEQRHIMTDPVKLADALVQECLAEQAKFREKYQKPAIISEMPPALIVKDVLSPELCAKCIHAFRSGHTFDGTVGAMEKKAYRADIKVRTDCIVEGELLAELDEKLSRSFFPEIKKIFGVGIAYRELYKIGLYSSDKQGFFKQHRDNFDVPMGYRRIAATIHLNDDYEGGGLRFPEYDQNIYRPAAGGGIAFSCSTLHEAMPVTKGERFVLVCFLHGKEEEAYRRHFATAKGQPLKVGDYTPTIRQYPEVRQSREFYDKWRNENVRYEGDNAAPAAPAVQTDGRVLKPQSTSLGMMVNMPGNHRARKVFESRQGIIFDDFLPEDVYNTINNFMLTTDYERINTHGKSVRAWHVHDGFPLRTCRNIFYNAAGHDTHKGENVYPAKMPFDKFVEHILAAQPYVEHMVGKQSETWGHFSVTGWMYPHGTGLAMHDDGSGVYTGAYVYFLNPVWRPHWGGLLLLADEEANRKIHEYRGKVNQFEYYQRKWLHANPLDDMLMEHGFAQCVFPKRNRMVFIANDAYHMVTRVNEQSGDNLRMSLAGFFNRKK